MAKKMTKAAFEKALAQTLAEEFSVETADATDRQLYIALSMMVRRLLGSRYTAFSKEARRQGAKQVYYMSMEFLMGRSLRTNLYNLGLYDTARRTLRDHSVRLENVFDQEPDPGLGNGGLGRLAACYLDALATGAYPGTGYSILYEYGIFRQNIVNGWQEELADDWLPGGSIWLKAFPEEAVEVHFGGTVEEEYQGDYQYFQHTGYESILAVPHDIHVSGYESDGVSRLRLWQAKSNAFDMKSFNAGNFGAAMVRDQGAELISKVLYPNDQHPEGRALRLRQQYFLSAASMGDILRRHLYQYGTADNLPEKVAVQLNDTHPTLSILEMMRLLMDECGYTWQQSLAACRKIFSYTNHTVMSEALERWEEDLFKQLLPRVYGILLRLDQEARADFAKAFPGDSGKAEYMSLLSGGVVRMANICAYVCHTMNGVSALHSEIIKESVFRDYYLYSPRKFTNVTNGIAWRRWMLQANPGLTKLIEDAIGPEFKKDASLLSGLSAYQNDAAFLAELEKVKLQNKARLSDAVRRQLGESLDPEFCFDVQAKRLHEYKRQHMNALHILSEYLAIKKDPSAPVVPKAYLFGAKAAPGYYMAKQIIRFISTLRDLIHADPNMKDKLQVLFLPNYSVTMSELLMPAAEISEQISLAGTEASGTGNMKFMLDGAVTLGTLDGANIEIKAAAGEKNFIQFGMTAEEVMALRASGYQPKTHMEQSPRAKEAMDFLRSGLCGQDFSELYDNLTLYDPFMVLGDFDAYADAQSKAKNIYRDKTRFLRMCLANIAGAGVFSADRAIGQYAQNIWNIQPVSSAEPELAEEN